MPIPTGNCVLMTAQCLCSRSDSNGSVYESVLSLRTSSTEAEGAQKLPRSLCLSLPVGEGQVTSGAAVVLDEAHVAVVGFPHPAAGTSKGNI